MLIVRLSIALESRVKLLLQRRVVSHVQLQLHKLLGHLVRRPLGEDPQDGPPGLVHLDPPAEGQPAGAGALNTNISFHVENISQSPKIIVWRLTWSMISLSCITLTPISLSSLPKQ